MVKNTAAGTSTLINLPSVTIQADRRTWLQKIRRGEHGDPALLLSGLSSADRERWEIGVESAWQRAGHHSQIVLKLPKPSSHPEGEAPSTEYWFDQETVWLLQAHIVRGGKLYVMGSKHNSRYYPAIQIAGHDKPIPVDRLIGDLGPFHDARKVVGSDYHDHSRASIRSVSERWVAAQVGREHERANVKAGKVTRGAAIEASLKLWQQSVLFPSLDDYRAALLDVYAVLDQRHHLGRLSATPVTSSSAVSIRPAGDDAL